MYKKNISDIVEYLNFLDKGQYSIYISMPDKVLIPYIEKTAGLLPFLSGEPMTNNELYYSIPLKHNLNIMLWLHIRRKNGKLAFAYRRIYLAYKGKYPRKIDRELADDVDGRQFELGSSKLLPSYQVQPSRYRAEKVV